MVWKPGSPSNSTTGYWIVYALLKIGSVFNTPANEYSYVHGGAWRDAKRTALDIVPTIKHILSSYGPKDDICGFASIDYRLSPSSPDAVNGENHGVQHPDHIIDVRTALRHLNAKYSIDDKYILMGHSAGATLTFQLLMGEEALRGRVDELAPKPAAVVGLSGIYDMVNLNKRFGDNYAGFLGAAFGDDRQSWVEASPAQYRGNYKNSMAADRPFMLAASPEDRLIDVPEMDSMIQKLEADGLEPEVVRNLHGDHDDIWSGGSQIAALVFHILPQLPRLK
jgi:acetyl esterase/lipase